MPSRDPRIRKRAQTGLRAAAAFLAAALVLSGCGSGGDSGQSTSRGSSEAAAAKASAAARHAAERKAPRGSSSVLRTIYAEFPPPEPDPKVQASAGAIRAGQRACAGSTPTEIERRYYSAAVSSGTLEPGSQQAKAIAGIATYEKHAASDSSFVAGQLAADAYQATLPQGIAGFGYQGCVYALARGLEKWLAP